MALLFLLLLLATLFTAFSTTYEPCLLLQRSLLIANRTASSFAFPEVPSLSEARFHDLALDSTRPHPSLYWSFSAALTDDTEGGSLVDQIELLLRTETGTDITSTTVLGTSPQGSFLLQPLPFPTSTRSLFITNLSPHPSTVTISIYLLTSPLSSLVHCSLSHPSLSFSSSHSSLFLPPQTSTLGWETLDDSPTIRLQVRNQVSGVISDVPLTRRGELDLSPKTKTKQTVTQPYEMLLEGLAPTSSVIMNLTLSFQSVKEKNEESISFVREYWYLILALSLLGSCVLCMSISFFIMMAVACCKWNRRRRLRKIKRTTNPSESINSKSNERSPLIKEEEEEEEEEEGEYEYYYSSDDDNDNEIISSLFDPSILEALQRIKGTEELQEKINRLRLEYEGILQDKISEIDGLELKLSVAMKQIQGLLAQVRKMSIERERLQTRLQEKESILSEKTQAIATLIGEESLRHQQQQRNSIRIGIGESSSVRGRFVRQDQ